MTPLQLFHLFFDSIRGCDLKPLVNTFELECSRCGARRPGWERG